MKKYLAYLISPMAIGFYITMVTVAFTFQFYSTSSSSSERDVGGVAGLLLTAHQKSIDYRLKARGPRPVAPNVGLIAVDERAVEAVGRWPWPRAKIAQGVENAMKYGAKVLAFDIAFSEPSTNPAEEVLLAAKNTSSSISAEFEKNVNEISPLLDNDRILQNAFTTHSNRVVAGAFSTDIKAPDWPGEMDFCFDLIYKMTPQAKQWDKEEVLITPNDPFQPYMPTALHDLFKDVLAQREKDLREKLGPPKSRNEEVLVNQKVIRDLHDSCRTILDDFREDLNQQWAEVTKGENSETFSFASYDEWLADYRMRSLPNGIWTAFGWYLNTPQIAEGTKHTAFFNTEQDPDGTIRSKLMILRSGNSYFPALSLKAALVANDWNVTPTLEFNPATGQKELTKMEVTSNETGDPVFTIPTDGKSALLLNYAGPQKMYPYVSFADLLSDSDEAVIEQKIYDPKDKKWKLKESRVKKTEFFKDKVFVVGATAMGIYDLRVTPFEENYPGAETHLNAIDNILSRNFFRTLPDERVYMPIILGAVGLILSVALSYLGALPGLLLTLAFLIGTALFDQYYLFNRGMVVTIVWPFFLISFLYVALTFYRYLTEERGKKELRQTFQKYVSPAIVEEILADPQNIELGGKKVNLTVFFSDVRGFTTISEKLDPRALSDLLNSYLTPMTDIVFKNRGTLDKYMGDAIMAFFGAPVHYPDHAKYACRCALLSVQKLFELQKDWAAKGLPTIDLGIGLNTGEVSVGNMGSETVRSYTVMGDAVNLASRLEGINKTYGTRIILSEMTYKDVKDNFICREVDWVRVKGKALPVKIYELLAEEKVASASMAEMLKWFHEGYELYHQKAWDKGLACFSKVLDKIPTDEVSKLYVQRCQDYIQEPPPSDWDGVFVMKTK